MNDFFLDLWQDLREKRLWPVAAALLLALVAVPFVLIKPAKVAPPQAAAGVGATSAKPLEPMGAGLLQPAENSVSDGSALEAFLSKDPFKPIKSLHKAPGVAPTSVTSTSGATAGAASSGGASGGGSTAPPVASGGGSPGGATTGGGTTTTTKTWTYVANLHFGRSGHEKAYKNTKQLTVIPDEQTPLLVFLGVTGDRRKAVFLVDSKLQTSGEGRCKPSTDKCSFLYLAQDADNNEQLFTDTDGTEYTLRLDDLKKLDLSKAEGSGGRNRSSGKQNASGREPSANGSTFARSTRSFGFSLFGAEQTTVQTTVAGSSAPATVR
jgi:hypothetical protein